MVRLQKFRNRESEEPCNGHGFFAAPFLFEIDFVVEYAFFLIESWV